MRRLPPLAAVRVFEAAARHLNFTAAAAELGMTQAAVSYQVKALEAHLGIALFRRDGRGIQLTPAGERAAPQVARGFDALDAAFARLRSESESALTVSTTQTFANTWLAWRLGGFQVVNPAMAVRLVASDAITDFARDEVDVAIRAGRGPWPGLERHLLFQVDFTPMCSPDFLARQGGLIMPADIVRLPMISANDPWWPHWLREAGVELDENGDRPGVRLDVQSHEGHAAMAGQGIALLTPFLWQTELAAGRLVRLSDQLSTRGFGYWLVYPEERRMVPKIKRFREWLLAEIARERHDPPRAAPATGQAAG
ncbi:transcriptional regulator GcvA [Sphingomonas sp.]|uniref:transcriptional regulator GcvA n=1 Tax=Sphingomonas sp. TaxID=28214 RepID=UPI003B3ABC07